MKNYKATYWRSNPQLSNGGYETTRAIDARTLVSAKKKAQQIADKCVYGGMTLLKIEEANV